MKLEHYNKEQLKKEINTIVFKYVDKTKYKVFIFGSRVSGTSRQGSDIDIGIIGDQPIPYHILGDIKEDLDNIRTLYTFDVVDFARTTKEFQDIALKHVEYIYG